MPRFTVWPLAKTLFVGKFIAAYIGQTFSGDDPIEERTLLDLLARIRVTLLFHSVPTSASLVVQPSAFLVAGNR